MPRNTAVIMTAIAVVSFAANSFAIFNTFIDARTATITAHPTQNTGTDKGRFTAGTGAGQNLLYGYPDIISTSFTTIKIDAPGNTVMIFGWGPASGTFTADPADSFDASNNSANTCVWEANGTSLEVTQELKIVPNPRTGINKDTIQIKYILKNKNTVNVHAGVRLMLDTELGINDNSPITVEGTGRIMQETKWMAPLVPEAWITVDDIDNPQIKAEGYLAGFGATTPDELIIGQWSYMNEAGTGNLWDYSMHAEDIADTAVSIFWYPVTITANGGTASFITFFGIPDTSGEYLSITKTADKLNAARDDTISYNIAFEKPGVSTVSNLFIWDSIPYYASFLDASPGFITGTAANFIYWPLGSVESGNIWFRVTLTAADGAALENRAFSSYTDSYWNDMEVKNSNKVTTYIFTATITPTWTISQTWTVSPTFTITPTPQPELSLTLINAFPNPAKAGVNIVFRLSRSADVSLKILTVSAENVIDLPKLPYTVGVNSYYWDGRNLRGKQAAAGVYLFILNATDDKGEKARQRGKVAVIK
jgi:hypothetical protein